jgi:hypothetical protein
LAEEPWSQWLDFDRAHVDSVPESSGVFVMHASMKTLYIGGSDNMRAALEKCLSDDCSSKAKRFKYMPTPSPESVADRLVKEFAQNHGGKPPPCNG